MFGPCSPPLRGDAPAGAVCGPGASAEGSRYRPRHQRSGPALATLSQRIEYLGYRLGTGLLAYAPEGAIYGLAAALARGFHAVGGRRSRIAWKNLELVFPEKTEAEREALARRSFVELFWAGIDLARVRRWDAEELRRRVPLEGREHLEKAAAGGRGFLVLIPHLSSLELALRAAPAHGIPICVMTKPASNPMIDAHLNAERERAGASVLAHRRVLDAAMDALRGERPLVISNDQYERRGRAVEAAFFGHRVPTGRGVATLSLRTGAPVVPVYIAREGPERCRLVCRPSIEPVRASAYREDVLRMTERYNREIEEIVRLHPEQYLWSHKRFRHSPDLSEGFYTD
jgi:KDO2-lipid IV(A) lauroyltransferase